ncbi:MAG: hypothetical protein K0U78_13625 [Actinomycetia bacterium]|nr:hypothetical protein [Actinomycetes bacterium]
MDIERLRTDPAYWDEVAPEGATHFDPFDQVEPWLKLEGGEWFAFDGGWRGPFHAGDGFITDNHGPKCLPRPSQPQWRGPEEGLPPVGTVCEYQSDVRSWQAGDRVEVLAHRPAKVESVAVVWNLRTKQARGVIAGVLGPLKSDKERAVEAAMEAAGYLNIPNHLDSVEARLVRPAFQNAYDAGLLRLPEEQS